MTQEYRWDLEQLLEKKPLNSGLEEIENFRKVLLQKYTDDLFLSREKLQEFHSLLREFDILANRVQVYISNSKNTDLDNPYGFKVNQELVYKSIPFAQKFSNFEAKVIKHQKLINSYLEEDSPFSELKRHYYSLFRYKNRRLPPTLAKFELTFAPVSEAYYELFNIISEREFLLEDVVNSKGDSITVYNYSTYISMMRTGDSVLRKSLFLKYYEFIRRKKESLFKLLYYEYLHLNIEAKNLSFKKGYIERSLYSDELPLNFLTNLYKNMKNLREFVEKFRNLRKKLIVKTGGLEKYERGDAYLELKRDKETEKKYSIEEAKEVVLSSLSVLGDQYIDSIEKIFENRGIDGLPRKGKISGAYFSDSSYKLPGKYILLNFNGYFNDILTLAHELGHAVHDMEIDKLETYYYSPTIFVAEIPSILNELIVNQHFLEKYRKEGNKIEQLFIYDHLLNTFIDTAVVQLTYSEGEFYFNERLARDEVVELDDAINKYDELIALYLGKEKIVTKKKYAPYRILTIPHFYSGNFYVYKYAVGLLSSIILSERILNPETRKESLENYYRFLSVADSLSNLDSLKLLNISLNDRSTWVKVKKTFQEGLSEYQKLAKELYGIVDE